MKRNVLNVVMDGVGVRRSKFGNAVTAALTPNLRYLEQKGLYTQLKAHGTYVGLPSDKDMGNSEVGHNALGAGRVYDQGAKLAQNALSSGDIFEGSGWEDIVKGIQHSNTLHLIGLLSDGNVHSHQEHLHALIAGAKSAGVQRVRVHALLDGRDVGEKSAEIYVDRLAKFFLKINGPGFDVKVASGGGRMLVTMDRYEADWSIVERGWKAHVLGEAEYHFDSIESALRHFRKDAKLTDQNLPAFVIQEEGRPAGEILDGDSVVCFNFRGDRAIQISKAFEQADFSSFERRRVPKVCYAGMMQYDGDLKLPQRFLVAPPKIEETFGEFLCEQGVRQYACSETQKFGHVTYFWNGNRSGKFNDDLEEYVEIPSDRISFHLKPAMQAYQIMTETVARMKTKSFSFGRINFANGDMVGHTGDFEAAVIGVGVVDLMIGHLIQAAKDNDYILIITADHGNCDEMFDANEVDFPNWENLSFENRPKPKTSHSLSEVPLMIYDPRDISANWKLRQNEKSFYGLANIAATATLLMGLDPGDRFEEAIIEKTKR